MVVGEANFVYLTGTAGSVKMVKVRFPKRKSEGEAEGTKANNCNWKKTTWSAENGGPPCFTPPYEKCQILIINSPVLFNAACLIIHLISR